MINETSLNNIKTISQLIIKKELLPVIKKGEKFNLNGVKEKVIKELSNLLILNKNELLYLEEFSKGNYIPSLLFDFDTSKRIENHPMAKRRSLSSKNKN